MASTTGEPEGISMTEPETAARAIEIRFTSILSQRQMTSLLRASPQVNRARWRIWAVMTLSAGFFFAIVSSIGSFSDLRSWAIRSAFELAAFAIMILLLVVANPWWLPRLAPRRAMVGLPTHWRLTRAAAEMTGVRGAMSIAWNTVETVLEKDGLLVLITKAPRRLIGFPLSQLEASDIATIRHWVDTTDPARPEVVRAEARPADGIVVTVAPLTRSQALTVARGFNRRLPILTGSITLFAVLAITAGVTNHEPLSRALVPLIPLLVVVVAFALLIWVVACRLTKLQPFAGTWAFDPSGVSSPNPLGAAFTPWNQIKLVMVRRDVLLLRLGYAKAILGLPTGQLSGNDLEQILSWATAAQVRTR
jgi:hypothetical protein